jgi:hypothetical protein
LRISAVTATSTEAPELVTVVSVLPLGDLFILQHVAPAQAGTE